jgi:hypothetical protein
VNAAQRTDFTAKENVQQPISEIGAPNPTKW